MAVLSMVGQKYKLTKDMKEAADALQLTLADAAITLRQIYADAPGQGTVVWKMGTKGKEAAKEIEYGVQRAAGRSPRAASEKVVSMRKGRERKTRTARVTSRQGGTP